MQPSTQTETQCMYVSTCGLSLICDQPPIYYGRQRKYTWNPEAPKGTVVYTHCRDLPQLVQALNLFKHPIVIVVNGDDNLMPYDYPPQVFSTLSSSSNVLAVYSQNNCVVDNPKFKWLPIGMDYHTLNWEQGSHLWGKTGLDALQQEMVLKLCKQKMKPIHETQVTPVVTNFQLAMKDPPRRAQLRLPIYEACRNVSWMKWLPEQSRKEFWLSLQNITFVLCAPGNGFDTHRAWEVLILGRIPIVQKLPINAVYDGLPIWEVDDWNKFASMTEADIEEKHKWFVDRWDTYTWERLTLAYWKNELNKYKGFE